MRSFTNLNLLKLNVRYKISLLIVAVLLISLPLFIWAIVTQRFDIRDRASNTENALLPALYLGQPTAPFKVLFIQVNNSAHFDAIVDGVINNKFKTITPYKENIDLMAFYKISINIDIPNSEICHGGSAFFSSGLECDSVLIFEEIKSIYPEFVDTDFINVALVEHNGGSGGSGQLVSIGINPEIDKNTNVLNESKTIIHEVSHQFGLLDYTVGGVKYDGSPNSFWDPEYLRKFYNLDAPGCSKWCQTYKPVSEYKNSVSSECLNFTDKNSCLSFNRVPVDLTDPNYNEHCVGSNCCVWSDQEFEYFGSRCVPFEGKENIGLQCIPKTGCYFGGAYGHYVWRPYSLDPSVDDTIMSGGNGGFDGASERLVESVFRCCMGSNYSSSLTNDLNCTQFKSDYEAFLTKYNVKSQIGQCKGQPPSTTAPGSNYLNWETENVSIKADYFTIFIDEKQFMANSENTTIREIVTTPTEIKLEVETTQHDKNLKLQIKFTSDETHWSLQEVTIFENSGSWVAHSGSVFDTPLGESFTDSVGSSYYVINPDNRLFGLIYYQNLSIIAFTKKVTSTPPSTNIFIAGDINGDGKVNIIDLGILIDNYGKSVAPNTNGDLNNDGDVNIIDLGILIDNYNN